MVPMRVPLSFGSAAAWLAVPTVLLAQAPAPDSVRALLRSGARDVALAYARAQSQTLPNDAWAHHALALAALAHDDHDAAVAAAERSVQLSPNESRHHELLGDAYFEKAGAAGGLGALGSAKKGKAAMERAVALDPDNLGARNSLVGFHLEAPGIAGGDKAEAARQAAEIARRDPARGVAAKLRVALVSNDEYEVTYAFEQALQVMATAGDSTNLVRNALLNAVPQTKKDATKEKLMARLYAALPGDPVVRYARARMWVIQGKQLADAVGLLQSYLALPQPPAGAASFGGAHWRLGQAYEKLKREPEALAEYRRAVDLLPQLEDAKQDLARLERRLARR